MSLKINNLTKKFGDRVILENFSYSFDDVGIYAITGASGIGKTTLLRIIAGLDEGFSGTVADGGRERVSVCFQEYRLFPELSALDNVALACFDKPSKENYTECINMLSRLGFSSSDMKLMPRELSGGMRQRVSLARAFIRQRPILLLDEATKELDPAHVKGVLDIIKELSLTRLVLLITHSKSDLTYLSPKAIITL